MVKPQINTSERIIVPLDVPDEDSAMAFNKQT